MMKSLLVAYVLWAVGGPLGLHHLYLDRDSHALLWMLTLGGFGVGWVRDGFRLPAYVSEASGPSRGSPSLPPVGPVRLAGQVCVGVYFGCVALVGLQSLRFFHLLVLPLSVGVGVHLVSTIGRQTSDLPRTLAACVVTSAVFYGSALAPLPISLAATTTAVRHRRVRPLPPRQRLGLRLYRLGLAWLAFSAPLGFCVFLNTSATLQYLADGVAALLDIFWFLPWLKAVIQYFLLLPYRILCVLTGGCEDVEAWRSVLEVLLSHREREALQVLGLDMDATLEEIGRNYRELAKARHPDQNPGPGAEAAFIQLHDAYQVLIRRHRPRRFG